MKNGTIDLKSFLLLDFIRDIHKVKDINWAKASGLKYAPRISELRASALGIRNVKDRAFHYKKWVALKHGLEAILGEEIVRKDLAELIEKTKDDDEQLMLLVTAIPKDRKRQAIDYLKLLVQVPSKKQQKTS